MKFQPLTEPPLIGMTVYSDPASICTIKFKVTNYDEGSRLVTLEILNGTPASRAGSITRRFIHELYKRVFPKRDPNKAKRDRPGDNLDLPAEAILCGRCEERVVPVEKLICGWCGGSGPAPIIFSQRTERVVSETPSSSTNILQSLGLLHQGTR